MTKTIEQARREAFEAWYVTDCLNEAGIEITVAEVSTLRGAHGDYRERAALHGKWIGYNAALDSLCIELPFETYGCMAASEVIDAIHAAGVKTR